MSFLRSWRYSTVPPPHPIPYFSIASESRKTFRRADWSDRKHSCKEIHFFPHRVTNTRENHLKQQRCQQSVPSGSIFFVLFVSFFFVLVDVVIVSLQTFFGFATVIGTNDMTGPHPFSLFFFVRFLSRLSESSELTGPTPLPRSQSPRPLSNVCPIGGRDSGRAGSS